MNFNNIVSKFNYSEDFSKLLNEIYKELIKMFQNEELVYEALFNTKIVNVNNTYDYLKDNNLLENDDALVSDDDMKRSAGVYHSSPIINFNNGNFELSGVKRVVAVVNLDLTRPSSKATLIHELCHLIKSYYKEYTIEGNILTCNSGLITSTYELEFDGEVVKRKLIKEEGVGLEEGLTSVQEEVITRNIIDSEYKSSGYGVVNAVASNLLNIPNIEEIIINAEVYHDKSELYNFLGIDDYESLEKVADKIYKINLEMFGAAMNFEKMNKIAEHMKKILREEYVPLRDKMETNLKRS